MLYHSLTAECGGHRFTAKGKAVPASEATEKLDKMAQSLGDLIDRENELLKGQIESTKRRLKS